MIFFIMCIILLNIKILKIIIEFFIKNNPPNQNENFFNHSTNMCNAIHIIFSIFDLKIMILTHIKKLWKIVFHSPDFEFLLKSPNFYK
jgi:hypothetical protein